MDHPCQLASLGQAPAGWAKVGSDQGLPAAPAGVGGGQPWPPRAQSRAPLPYPPAVPRCPHDRPSFLWARSGGRASAGAPLGTCPTSKPSK